METAAANRTRRRLNSQRGTKSKEAGKAWEREIRTQLHVGEHDKLIAFWAHAEPTFRLVWQSRAGRPPEKLYLPVKAGFADFSGVLAGGLSFALECKSTMKACYHRSDISEAQQEHLTAVANAGGLSLLALKMHTGDEASGFRVHEFLIPWGRVPWRQKRSADSVSVGDLDEWKMRRPRALARFASLCPLCGCALIEAEAQAVSLGCRCPP